MSLINQVLQDLEKRHASEPELKSLPPHVRAISEDPRSGNATLFVVAALIVFTIIAAYLFFGGWLRHSPGSPGASKAQPVVQAPQAPAVVEHQPSAQVPETAVQAQLIAPASRLSGELSFVPDSRPRRDAGAKLAKAEAPPPEKYEAARADKPAASQPVPQVNIPAEFRKAIEAPAPVPAATPQPVAPPVPVAPASAAPVPGPAASADSRVVIDKQVREMTPQQRAELAFRKGVNQIQESRASAAEASFREALREDPSHVAARQALLGLMLDAKRNQEAEQLLKQTLDLNPRQPRHAMVLARLEVDRGEVTGAINTLVAALPYVQSDPEYYAFLAALLQREGRHRETVDYYRAALRTAPGNGLWLMGLGISLRATSQFAEARESFQRAIETKQLNGELQAFTERQLRELGAPKK
jgi:MSHA biogenesis protein MshN